MATKYRLDWKSLETGNAWHGEPVYNSFEAADEAAKEFNIKHPSTPCRVTSVIVPEDKQEKEK